jgi:hypothetical protein
MRVLDMKLIRSFGFLLFTLTFLAIPIIFSTRAYAATDPLLEQADSFVILSDTYTNTVGGTTLTGDLGYTTGPATAPTVNGITYTGGSKYNQAGIDQAAALVALNNQPCTFEFDPGAIDLASNTDFPTSTYTPGVYCITGAASIGGGGTVTLNGAGTYIFRMDGALTTSASSLVVVTNGASVCSVWWTPTSATTLGATSTFAGNVIDNSGITIGSTVTWTGRALAFGGTVTTDTDTISVGSCVASIDEEDEEVETPGLPNTSSTTNSSGMQYWGIPVAILLTTLLVVSGKKLSKKYFGK